MAVVSFHSVGLLSLLPWVLLTFSGRMIVPADAGAILGLSPLMVGPTVELYGPLETSTTDVHVSPLRQLCQKNGSLANISYGDVKGIALMNFSALAESSAAEPIAVILVAPAETATASAQTAEERGPPRIVVPSVVLSRTLVARRTARRILVATPEALSGAVAGQWDSEASRSASGGASLIDSAGGLASPSKAAESTTLSASQLLVLIQLRAVALSLAVQGSCNEGSGRCWRRSEGEARIARAEAGAGPKELRPVSIQLWDRDDARNLATMPPSRPAPRSELVRSLRSLRI